MEHPSLNHCCILKDAGTSLFCWRIYAPIIKTVPCIIIIIILLYLETHRISKTCQINVKIKYHILICNLYLIFCTTNICMKCLWGKCMYVWICGIWDFPFLLNQPNQNIITSDIIWKHLVLTRMEQCTRRREHKGWCGWLERDQLINAMHHKIMMIYDIPVNHVLLAVTSEEISQHKWHVSTLMPSLLCINDEMRMQCKQDKQKK